MTDRLQETQGRWHNLIGQLGNPSIESPYYLLKQEVQAGLEVMVVLDTLTKRLEAAEELINSASSAAFSPALFDLWIRTKAGWQQAKTAHEKVVNDA